MLGSEIGASLGRRRAGYGLEGAFYHDAEIFAADLELIFRRHWIFVAVEPDVPEPGDYVRVDIGTNSVIVVRDDEGEVRAFHNVCRHRGARIVEDERGFVGNLVCPYHRWTYDLGGKLLHAPLLPEECARSSLGLKPVHVRSVAGLIFICLADEAPADFAEFAASFAPYLAPHRLQDCKVAKRIDLVEEGNWKLTMENNRECYHCDGHPELLRSFFHYFGYGANDVSPAERARYERQERVREGHVARWQARGLKWEAIELLEGRSSGFRTERLAFVDGAESYTMDTKVACRRPMADFDEKRLGSLHLHTQPNSWHHFLSDHAVTFAVLPLAVDRTLVRTTWLVHKKAVEGVDYDLENLTKVWSVTNEQDAHFVALAQSGTSSPAYEPGPYTAIEYQTAAFCNWYLQRLQAALPQ